MRQLLTRALSVAVVLAGLGLPRIAEACYVCMAGRDEDTRFAFLATTGLLSVLPFALVGGLIWYIRRRARQLDDEDARLAGEPVGLSRTSSSQ